VEVVIEDAGPGFRQDDLRAVIEPFFSRRRGATGLGLALAARIVEEHGGSIEVTSDGGACFRVRFPAVAAAAATRPEPGHAARQHTPPASGDRVHAGVSS
jgi:signal transduction histidine kinase